MHITFDKAEKAAKWGRAGFGLVLAVLSVINLAVESRKRADEEPK